MKLAAPVTAAVVTVLLAGLAGPAAGGGQPGPDHAPAASGLPAALGTVTAASHDIGHGTEPQPAVSASSSISSMACPSARECVAVGWYTDSSGADQVLLLTGNGSSWTAATAPVPAGAATRPQTTIIRVACPSARECVAVGGYYDSSGHEQGLLLTGYGSSWTAAKAPVPADAAGSGAFINAIACPSATACTAIGEYTDSSGNSHLFVLTMRGSSWTAATAPLPAGAPDSLGPGISVLACPSATACTAVGDYTVDHYHDPWTDSHLFLLTMRGSSWTAATTPLPGAPTSAIIDIGGIACPSATACVAAGWYDDAVPPSLGGEGLLLTMRGTSWTAATPPLPAGVTGGRTSVSAVACPSATLCTAVGGYESSADNSEGLLLTQHQGSWTAATAPVPPGAAANPYSSITAVACPSATTCTAAGSYTNSAGNGQVLLLTQHQGSWTAATAPVPAGAPTSPQTFITGMACPSATACTAFGGYTDSSGNNQGLLLTMHGSSWTAVKPPLPAGAATS
jgi:hypothetical protein